MAVNPMALLHLKERLSIFQKEHPKVRPFLHAVKEDAIVPGTILELKITTQDGRERVTNIRLTENDIETIQMLSKQK